MGYVYTNIKDSFLKSQFVKNAFALYFGRSINLFIGLFSTLIYGIIFKRKEIAVISLYEMIVFLFFELGFSWSKISLTRFGKEELKKHNAINHTSSIRIGIIFPLFIISVLIILYLRNSFLDYINTQDQIIIAFILFHLFLLIIHEHIIYIIVTLEKHIQNVFYYIGLSFGKLIILGVFYFNLSGEISAELYIKYTVFLLLILLFIRGIFFDIRNIFPLVLGKKEDYIKQLKFAAPMIYGISGLYIINWVDAYYIRKYWSFDDLGSYQFLYSIFLKFTSFAVIINTLFFPKIMDWKITGNINLKKYLEKAPIFLLLGTLICFVIFLIFYPKLFHIFFKNKYQNAYSAFNILIITIPFVFLSYIYIPVLNSFDRVNYIQFVNIVSATCNILIDYYFIRKFGLIAAATGTFVAYFGKYILLSLAVRKMFQISYKLVHTISALIIIFVIIYFINIYS